MKRKTLVTLGTILLVVLVAAAIVAANFRSIVLFVVGNRGKDHPVPNIEVAWSQGPPRPAAGDRPPNIVFILADDLGINDITTYGGGMARGLVPTPNVDALAAAGTTPPTDRVIDGANLLPYLTGRRSAAPPHEAIFWQDGGYLAVLKGGWKLQTSDNPKKGWLFHVAVDPTEQTNLAAAEPAKIAELKAALAEHRRGGRPALFPATSAIPVTIDKTLEQKATKADEYIYWPG